MYLNIDKITIRCIINYLKLIGSYCRVLKSKHVTFHLKLSLRTLGAVVTLQVQVLVECGGKGWDSSF